MTSASVLDFPPSILLFPTVACFTARDWTWNTYSLFFLNKKKNPAVMPTATWCICFYGISHAAALRPALCPPVVLALTFTHMHADAEGRELKLTVDANTQSSIKATWKLNTGCAHMWVRTWMFSGLQIIHVCVLWELESWSLRTSFSHVVFYSTGARTLSKITTT